jgi:hypothetical protein
MPTAPLAGNLAPLAVGVLVAPHDLAGLIELRVLDQRRSDVVPRRLRRFEVSRHFGLADVVTNDVPAEMLDQFGVLDRGFVDSGRSGHGGASTARGRCGQRRAGDQSSRKQRGGE